MSESMQESMEREIAEAIRLMEKANTALSRLFNTDEGENKVSTCIACLGDFNTEDMQWDNGYQCESCKGEGE
jgi:PHP family Zn ribbon phosphoesterase